MTFTSRHHPGKASRALVVAAAQALPVAVTFLAIILVSVAAALQGLPILKPLLVVVPVAYGLAAWLGMYVVQRRAAEVRVDGGRVLVRSPLDVAARRLAPFVKVHSVLLRNEGLVVAMGDEVRTFQPREWKEFGLMRAALTEAAHQPDVGP